MRRSTWIFPNSGIMKLTAKYQHWSTKKYCTRVERKEHAEDSEEELSPKNDFLEESEVHFRKVFGIVNMIQEDISLKNKVGKP